MVCLGDLPGTLFFFFYYWKKIIKNILFSVVSGKLILIIYSFNQLINTGDVLIHLMFDCNEIVFSKIYHMSRLNFCFLFSILDRINFLIMLHLVQLVISFLFFIVLKINITGKIKLGEFYILQLNKFQILIYSNLNRHISHLRTEKQNKILFLDISYLKSLTKILH